jgi:DNA polymerase IIIc chi subunit
MGNFVNSSRVKEHDPIRITARETTPRAGHVLLAIDLQPDPQACQEIETRFRGLAGFG